MTQGHDDATRQAWAALGGAERLLEHVSYGGNGGDGGPAGLLPARLRVMALARATVAACALAAAELAACRAGGRPEPPTVRVDDGALATAFTSERHLRIDGRTPETFAPLSRFWPAADGWVRTHANYPHHRAQLLAALGASDQEGVGKALAAMPAGEAEEVVYAAGGLAVAVRAPETWAAHPQGRAAAALPLVRSEPVDGPRGRPLPEAAVPLPAAGVRVLDLTRVIAGPVATRTLALLGADVLRVDSPRLPESPDAHADTGFGKRSTRLDLTRSADRAAFEGLLAGADVVVTGYRPGALDRFGLSAEALAERRPALVVAQLSAWGDIGPWSARRGFDSLVQAASGIALVEAGPDGRPGALPAQALDHGTGYLLAAAVLRALTDRQGDARGRRIRLALATTASWLLGSGVPPGRPAGAAPYDPAPWLIETRGPLGRLRHALPPVTFDGSPTTWSRPPGPWGTDVPHWPADASPPAGQAPMPGPPGD
jgi:hypothetical protein